MHDLGSVGMVAFALGFARDRAELDPMCVGLVATAGEDAIIWIAHRKKSSKRYGADCGRDRGWDALGAAG